MGNFGNGSAIGSSLIWQRCAMSQVRSSAFHLAEQRQHLFARLEVKLRLREAHPVGIRHGLAGLDAQQDFVRASVVLAEIVRIVGGHQRNSGVARQAMHLRHHLSIRIQAVILQFQEEILLAEEVAVFVGQALGFVVAIGQQGFVDIAAQACRERDQAFRMARQQVFIDARLVIETVQVTGGDQLDQVAVAGLVLAQQHQVVVAVGIALDGLALLRDVHFAADHRMDALLLGLVVELHRAEQIAVVGHGDGGHLLLLHLLHQLRDFAGSIEQRVVGVAMQMNKGRGHRIVPIPGETTSMPDIRIVPATERDVPVILELIRGLAEYERLSHVVEATEDRLRRTLFGERPAAEALLAYDVARVRRIRAVLSPTTRLSWPSRACTWKTCSSCRMRAGRGSVWRF